MPEVISVQFPPRQALSHFGGFVVIAAREDKAKEVQARRSGSEMGFLHRACQGSCNSLVFLMLLETGGRGLG